MALGRVWAGNAYGTNIGNIFLQLNGEDTALAGILRFHERNVAIVLYSVAGTFDGRQLSLTGDVQQPIEGMVFGHLTAIATLNARGQLEGQWETTIGSAGTFILFPHDRSESPADGPDQLHSARHHFAAVECSRSDLIAIAEELQREFKVGRLVVTVNGKTEVSRYLSDFKGMNFNEDKASAVKLFVQEPAGGVNRVVSIEFGPAENVAMTQGPDDAWVLGMLEKVKAFVLPFERSYSTNIKRVGFGVNQAMALGAIIVLPSLGTLRDRAVLIGVVFTLIWSVNKAHQYFLPFAAIYLRERRATAWTWIGPTILSWMIAATASIAAALVAAYLQGWIGLTGSIGATGPL